MHGGKNPGAPKGNQNSRTHGLFAGVFQATNPESEAVYQQALTADPKDNARDAAAVILANAHQAMAAPSKLGTAGQRAAEYLTALVDSGELDPASAQAAIERLGRPHPTQLAKALGPLKGLLDTANQTEDKVAGTLRDLLTAAEQTPVPQTDEEWGD